MVISIFHIDIISMIHLYFFFVKTTSVLTSVRAHVQVEFVIFMCVRIYWHLRVCCFPYCLFSSHITMSNNTKCFLTKTTNVLPFGYLIAKCILLELLNSSTFLRQSIYFKLESNTPAFLVTHTQFEWWLRIYIVWHSVHNDKNECGNVCFSRIRYIEVHSAPSSKSQHKKC